MQGGGGDEALADGRDATTQRQTPTLAEICRGERAEGNQRNQSYQRHQGGKRPGKRAALKHRATPKS